MFISIYIYIYIYIYCMPFGIPPTPPWQNGKKSENKAVWLFWRAVCMNLKKIVEMRPNITQVGLLLGWICLQSAPTWSRPPLREYSPNGLPAQVGDEKRQEMQARADWTWVQKAWNCKVHLAERARAEGQETWNGSDPSDQSARDCSSQMDFERVVFGGGECERTADMVAQGALNIKDSINILVYLIILWK